MHSGNDTTCHLMALFSGHGAHAMKGSKHVLDFYGFGQLNDACGNAGAVFGMACDAKSCSDGGFAGNRTHGRGTVVPPVEGRMIIDNMP